jgi:DNA invertase Pin-like site-specific DNA recombinase
MIACYCRVSSHSQKTDSQKAELTRWLHHQGLDSGAVQWFEDRERGQTLRRPAFVRLQRAIAAGAITTVVVWKLDRLARRQQDGINLLADWCARNVRVVAVTQQIDLSGPVGRMVASVLFGLAEIEWEYRRERQAAGIAVAKARGVYRGRRKGTTKAKPHRAQALRQTGLTVPEIARALGIGERTAFRYLTGSASSVMQGDHG